MPSLRVMTYNIHHGRGMDDVVDLARIAAIIAAAEPDIVSVQEVDRGKTRTGRVDQPAELARLTGLTPIYGPAIVSEDDGEYGNMALTRLPAREIANLPMPGEPRAALTLSCEAPGGAEFLFIATHFDTESEPRKKAPDIIERYLETRPPIPAILAGDLNARPHAETMQLLGAHWENTTEGDELPTIYPNDIGSRSTMSSIARRRRGGSRASACHTNASRPTICLWSSTWNASRARTSRTASRPSPLGFWRQDFGISTIHDTNGASSRVAWTGSPRRAKNPSTADLTRKSPSFGNTASM